jgi:small GTP-binding protein
MPNKIFLFGLDRAGKTALSRTIKGEEQCGTTRPTVAFDITKWMIKQTEFQVWDAPGQVRFRDIWDKGFHQANVLLFVVDAADTARFAEAKAEFDKVINNPETKGVPLMVCFHKIDLPEARANLQNVRAVFKLSQITNRKVTTFDTSIYGCEDIGRLKETLVDLLTQSRW